MDRRTFLAVAALAVPVRAEKNGMQLHLSCGALGIKASQREAVDLAAKHGFDVIDADGRYLGGLSDGELKDLLGYMKSKNIDWGLAGMPVDFRKDDKAFTDGMAAFPTYVKGLQRAGVRNMTTWVMPMSNDLPTWPISRSTRSGWDRLPRRLTTAACVSDWNISAPRRCGLRSAIRLRILWPRCAT